MTIRTLTRAAVLAALPLFPATAQADDASLYHTYKARYEELERVAEEYKAARRSFEHANAHHFAPRKARAIIRADRHINTALDKVIPEIRREEPSSGHGKQARAHVINEFTGWRRENVWEIRGLHHYLHHRYKAARRDYVRAYRISIRAYHEHKRAAAEFKKAGFG
jgi:hypothetical protein